LGECPYCEGVLPQEKGKPEIKNFALFGLLSSLVIAGIFLLQG